MWNASCAFILQRHSCCPSVLFTLKLIILDVLFIFISCIQVKNNAAKDIWRFGVLFILEGLAGGKVLPSLPIFLYGDASREEILHS